MAVGTSHTYSMPHWNWQSLMHCKCVTYFS